MSEEPNFSGEQNSEAAAPVVNEANEPMQQEQQMDRQVPLDALQAERAERQKLQDDLKMMKDHLTLMQANQTQPRQEMSKDDFDGLDENDVLTVKDLKRALVDKEKKFQTTIQELRMTQKYPDYQQVVTQYLPEVIKQNPSLAGTLQNSQDYELAYYLAKNSEGFKADHKKTKKNADAERIVQNANRAGSLSSVGQTSPISEAKRYKDMSDDDFKKTVQKNLGYY
jgi:hypothetical protein